MLTEKAAMYSTLGISKEVFAFGTKIEEELKERFAKIDEIAEYNQLKVIHAMQASKVSEACLYGTTGYGYNDLGRDTLEQVYATCFGTEDALVRPQIACGTHALATALSGNLRPGDELLSPVGKPYDTLEEVIGIRPSVGSLAVAHPAMFPVPTCAAIAVASAWKEVMPSFPAFLPFNEKLPSAESDASGGFPG